MIAHRIQESFQYRLALYYLEKLRTAEAIYQLGQMHSDYALTLFDQEWIQVKQWWNWAIAHFQDDDTIAQLCTDYSRSGADLLSLRQHPQERLDLLTIGLEVARQLKDNHAEMVHLYLIGNTCMYSGLSESARTFAGQAVALARQIDDQLYLMKSLLLLGDTLYLLDEYLNSQIIHQQALTLSKELDARKEMGVILNGLGNVAMSQNDYHHARDYFTQSLKIAEIHGQPTDVCVALHNLCAVSARIGDDLTAAMYGERCIKLCRTINYQYCLADVMIEVGSLAFEHGNLQEARHHYQESLEISRQIHHLSNEACVLGRLGHLLCRSGDIPASIEHLETALSKSQEIGSRWYEAIALKYMSEVFRMTGDFQPAALKLREGLEIIVTIQSNIMGARYLLEAAFLWHDQGDRQQVVVWMGVLEPYMTQVTEDERQHYHHLRHKLSTELGSASFNAIAESGKKLDLQRVLQEIQQELGVRMY